VREAKARATANGYMQSVADLLATKGMLHFAMDSRTYLVLELTQAGLEGINFGWGKGVYAGPATVSLASYCTGMQNEKGETGIRVSMHLPESEMERLSGNGEVYKGW
jgi:benzyl alcohol O-benzoyltransferase